MLKPSSRTGKVRQYRSQGQPGPELENHFILRFLEPQARILREDIRQGQTNIKDRLFIQLDYTQDKEDMRNGIITFDTIMYKARLVDLPTVLETLKTIDGKNFYKTADVCQMLMVRGDSEDPPEDEDTKKRKKDPNKVDKKYLWPHGYTPPLKNVRKRRFRKTMRKKVSNLENLDLPDIEKEVKRLLRTDNESYSIKWEVVREEDEKKNADGTQPQSNLDKQQLFGEMSSSEDEVGTTINIIDEDEDSHLSVEDSQFMNESANSPSSKTLLNSSSNTPLVTEFTASMFRNEAESYIKSQPVSPVKGSSGSSKGRSKGTPNSKKAAALAASRYMEELNSNPDTINKLYARLSHLESDMTRLLSQRAAHEAETATIENFALKQKFLAKLSDLETQIKDKEAELREVRSQLA